MIDRCCISIHERCDLRCRYCHFSLGNRRSADVDGAGVSTAIQKMIEYVDAGNIPSFKIGIVGGGEPTLRFDVLKLAVDALADDDRFRIYTISNGMHLDDDMLDYLYARRDRISFNISLDGYRELHDLNRVDVDGNGTFDRVMETARMYEKRFGQMPGVNCTITRDHLRNQDELVDFYVRNGFHDVTFSKIFDGPELEVSDGDFDRFISKASESLNLRQCLNPESFDCCKYGRRCGVGRTNIFYGPSGIYPCGRFSGIERYRLGDWSDDLSDVERRMENLVPVEGGACFYESRGVVL